MKTKRVVILMVVLGLVVIGGGAWWLCARSSQQCAKALENLANAKSIVIKTKASIKPESERGSNIEVDSQTKLSLEDGLSKSVDELRALGATKKLDYYIVYDGGERLGYFSEDSKLVKKNSRADDLNDYQSALVALKGGVLVKDKDLGYCLKFEPAVAKKIVDGLLGMYIDSNGNFGKDSILAPITVDLKTREITSINLDLTQVADSSLNVGEQIKIGVEFSDYNKDFGLKLPKEEGSNEN